MRKHYYIGRASKGWKKEEVSRQEVIEKLAIRYGTYDPCCGLGMVIANYDKAEKELKRLLRTKTSGVLFSGWTLYIED